MAAHTVPPFSNSDPHAGQRESRNSPKNHASADLGAGKISGAESISRYRKSENLQFGPDRGLEFSLNRN